ncbi:uncharacterized protein MELLADRAFT_100981 [Melampsora larici-populina 98AG31]|uniref:Uncharacterized protein n=1 Tax=Melampsora larici-populina (strain 98AG31 / pathotype 3-4-7) TaxID=747676 RepID=F4R373_MELLP|nr:uncharacterized protein MELLADRAFT_100981 [Melampsora larici-populina 98AG31]EGG12579.1 hypothetical protein MELLADRAFT_100981 [Melampsora larici-populina 98AG31]
MSSSVDMDTSSTSSEYDTGINVSKFRFFKLNQTNWAKWQIMVDSVLTSKGFDKLLDVDWNRDNKETQTYRVRNAWAFSLLWDIVESDLHDIIINNSPSFWHTYQALGRACGMLCIVTVSAKLRKTFNTVYNVGTSMKEHISNFNSLITSLGTSLASMPDFAKMSTGLNACIFLSSFNSDESLTPLIQTLYKSEPFTYASVYESMMLEANRRDDVESNMTVNFAHNQRNQAFNRFKKPSSLNQNSPNSQSRNQHILSRNPQPQFPNPSSSSQTNNGYFRPRGIIPTRFGNQRSDQNQESIREMRERLNRLENQMKSNRSNNSGSMNANSVSRNNNQDETMDGSCFMIESFSAVSASIRSDSFDLTYDSGATDTTVNNFGLIIDPKPTFRVLNTYGGTITVTHVGKMSIGGEIIYPVFYVPAGPRNLISASQLEDHGLTIHHVPSGVIIRKANRIILKFPRDGKLFVAKGRSEVNNIQSIKPSTDWHIILGNPSDEYLKQFLVFRNIKANGHGVTKSSLFNSIT